MMNSKKPPARNIDEYIADFPQDIQNVLEELRKTIGKSAPEAEESISYQIPTFTLKGNLVHFAAFKNHIGFYPGSSGIAAFKKELSPYKGAKGSVQFPMDKKIPLNLIRKIVKFRMDENLKKAQANQENKKKKMKSSKGQRRICDKGHTYYKKSDCPTCPICEQERKPAMGFLSLLSAPARRALEREGVTTLERLADFSAHDILQLHGIGPSTLPKLRAALTAKGLSFK